MSYHLGLSNEKALEESYPLHKACRDGDQETVSALLFENKHDLYEEDGYYGWTPMHWASYFGKLSCLMKLLDHGSSCDSATLRFNQSPLHMAALGGNSHCLKWLLHCGACISRQDYLGDTAIHKAARAGSMECISLLVAQNASIDMRNYNGQTPAEVALNSSHTHCSEYLNKALQLLQCGKLESAHIQNIHAESHNGHTMHNGHHSESISEDCDMEMEISHSHDHQNSHAAVQNGGHGLVNSEMNGYNGSGVFRAFGGMKRSLDDEDEEQIKRRCFRDKYHPAYHINLKTSCGSLTSSDSLSQSALEHTLLLQEQRGYDSLLAASLLHHD